MDVSEKNMIIMYYSSNYEMALNYIRTSLHVFKFSSLYYRVIIIVLSGLVLPEDLSLHMVCPVKLLSGWNQSTVLYCIVLYCIVLYCHIACILMCSRHLWLPSYLRFNIRDDCVIVAVLYRLKCVLMFLKITILCMDKITNLVSLLVFVHLSCYKFCFANYRVTRERI
jgi:hypothetical protein